MENRIKQAQLGLFANRTSCHYFAANQFRLLLSSLAYLLIERLRTLALAGTVFARLQATTLISSGAGWAKRRKASSMAGIACAGAYFLYDAHERPHASPDALSALHVIGPHRR